MSYTVWMDGTKIGETALEMRHGARKRAGVFHPTELGLSVLPGITAMGPALLDTGRMCRELGINTEDAALDVEAAADELFGTPPGQRVLAAASQIARLELRGPTGELVRWDSILISDVDEMAAAAARDSGTKLEVDTPPNTERMRYLISATLAKGAAGRSFWSRAPALS